ncbi:hypothetical protein SRIMM317S_03424 [Streptomyces rimosus subsp. rimosus]
MDPDRTGVAEYFADEVRQALLLDQVDTGPADRYLLPGPAVPLSAAGVDGTATFDGETVRVEWRWNTSESKKQASARTYPSPIWRAWSGGPPSAWNPAICASAPRERHRRPSRSTTRTPSNCGASRRRAGRRRCSRRRWRCGCRIRRVGARRRMHPVLEKAAGTGGGSGREDADVLLRRLRELGELHKDGILTAEEFATAKAAVLRGFQGMG